jgi:DNA-binding NarL/FixJ family response regulator
MLIDDHPVVLEGLARRINSEDDLVVCAEAQTPSAALTAIQDVKPDVVVMDLAFPEGHGLELIKDLRARQVRAPILVFSMFEDPTYAMRALKAGAQGYLTKHESSDQLVSGIRAVLNGDYAFSPDLSRQLLGSSLKPPNPPTDPRDCLGDRELEVFELLGRGIGTRQIAARLGRSIKTIETYRARIKRKLRLKDSSTLMREAVRWVETRKW